MKFPLWLNRLRTQHCLHVDTDWIPGLTQGVKYPVFLQVAAQAEDTLGSGVAMAMT